MKEQKELKYGSSEHLINKTSEDAKAIGLFFAPMSGNVERIARKIREKLHRHKSDIFHITDITPECLVNYRNIILVASTVGSIHWENDYKDEWSGFLNKLEIGSLEGHRVALVGLGDHIGYPDNFCDGLGEMAIWIQKAGGTLVGRTSIDNYTFNDSSAVHDRLFDGLPLDEENDADKSDARIDKWLSFVLSDFAIEK